MTHKEALAEARKRYGAYGYAGKLVEPAEMAENEEPIVMYWVGVVNDNADDFYSKEKGSGDSYEDAFADADSRFPLDPRD